MLNTNTVFFATDYTNFHRLLTAKGGLICGNLKMNNPAAELRGIKKNKNQNATDSLIGINTTTER